MHARRLTVWLLSGLLVTLATSVLAVRHYRAMSTQLHDFSGHVRTIGDYTGKNKWLLVMIWEYDCSVCNSVVHNYVDFQTFHRDTDATVLGISADGRGKQQAAERFLDRHNVNFPNLIGESRGVARLYTELTAKRWLGSPSFLLYNPVGKLARSWVGPVPIATLENYMRRYDRNH